MKKDDYLFDYLLTFKNPLDKKYRWEVNTAFKQNKITDNQRKSLLTLEPAVLYELSVCIRNGVKLDKAKLGNFYINRATDYAKRKQKKQSEKILDFSK